MDKIRKTDDPVKTYTQRIYVEDHARLDALLDRYNNARLKRDPYDFTIATKNEISPILFRLMLDAFEEIYVVPEETAKNID